MKRFKDIFWNFNFLIQQKRVKTLLLISFLVLAVFIFSIKKIGVDNQSPISALEYYSILTYFILVIGALFYNIKKWNLYFFSLLIASVTLAVIRTFGLLLLLLLISTILKFFGIILFQTAPYKMNKFFVPIYDLILFYPLIQFWLFSYQYKNELGSV